LPWALSTLTNGKVERMTLKYYAVSGIAVALLGCGGSVTGVNAGDSGSGSDSGTDAPLVSADTGSGPDAGTTTKEAAAPDSALNHGAPSTTYPAFTPFIAQVVDNGGTVIDAPQISTVTWTSLDSQTATWESFDDAIATTSYWSTVTAEYGIGTGSAGSHIELTTAPSFSSMTDIENFVGQNAGSTWPPSTITSNTLYVIYLPPGLSITVPPYGDACSNGIEGYHDMTTTPVGSTVIFSVVFQCSYEMTSDITLSASHEIVEASSDPIGNNTWYGFNDAQYLAWDIYQQQNDELADMCEFYIDDAYNEPTTGQVVQRIWTNKGGAGGSYPCVPAETGAYFNVTPLMQDTININVSALGGPSNYPGLGFYIPIGMTKVIPIGFYSDSAAPPWNIVVHAGNPLVGTTANVDATFDFAAGQNGTISYITVKVNGQDSSNTESNLITVESQVPGDETVELGPGMSVGVHSRWMPILISSEM
jgi:hypothetical protein